MKPLDILLILVLLLFGTGLIVDKRWGPERREHEKSLKFQRDHLEKVADLLRAHQKKVGRYPTMEEGLESVPGLRDATFSGQFKSLAPALELLPGVRTPHGIPYLYENRRAAEAEGKGAFRNSPSRPDRKQERYSERVDDGIVVTSLGLMYDQRRVFGDAWVDALLFFGGGALLALTILYIVARNRSKTADRYRGVNATISVGVAIVLALVFLITGGHHRLGGARQRPKFDTGTRADLATEYLDLLAGWVSAEVYSKDAYEKVSKQLASEFGIVPPVPGAIAESDAGESKPN